ncbi:MAG: hypothetical protein IJE51_01420 [Clostridia bacterium]|nr:hypothetical protein [Clostridia bacterium]
MKQLLKKIPPVLIFSIIFIIGIIVSYSTPDYVDNMIGKFTEVHSDVKKDGAFTTTRTDTTRIGQVIPYIAPAGYIAAAGLQLLGISGIVATILKKDD